MDRISFNYRMIEVARLSRGVLQTELAREMDVSQSAVSKWEQGEMSLKKDQIDRLCKVLDYPETFFEQQINILPQYAIYYRKKKSAKQLDLDKIRYSLFIQKHGLKKLLKSVDLPNKVRFLGVKYDRQPADIARIIRQDWKLPVGPIQNLTKTIEKAGIIVFLVSANCDEFDGMVLPDEDGLSVICINENLSPDRFRFTLAHELGHLIMHTNFFPSDDDDFEKQANDFASEFLMPEADIGRDFFDLTTSINGFATLKPHWGVSIQSLIYRAKELGFINLAKYKSLYVQIGQKNWRKDEPPMNMKRETPVIVQQMLEVFKDKLGYSDSEIAKILSLNLTDFRNFRNTYSSVFSLKIHK